MKHLKSLNKKAQRLDAAQGKPEDTAATVIPSVGCPLGCNFCSTSAMFGGKGETLVLNANNNLVKYVLDNPDGENTPTICCQLYDLAVLANRPLSADAMTKFVARSNEILSILAK